MIDPLIWLILLPLAWATLAFLLGPGRGAWVAIGSLGAQLWLALDLAQRIGVGATALTHPVGSWGAPLGIDLAADGLSAAMLLLTQAIALPLAEGGTTEDAAERDFREAGVRVLAMI